MGKRPSGSFLLLILGCTFLFLSGCATNRSIVALDVGSTATNSQSNGKQVFIQSVTDNREFQEHPKTQNIPSLGFGGANAATNEIKKRAIGRKRNGFGKALGDILLEDGKTVESVIRDSLKRAFSEMGFAVVENKEEAQGDTIVIDTYIQKFWAYMTPGFWAITLSSDVSTDLVVTYQENGRKKEETISVSSDGKYQMATDSNWREIVQQSLNKYISQIKNTFSKEL